MIILCQLCHGPTVMKLCPQCHGTKATFEYAPGFGDYYVPCTYCHGSGKVRYCNNCEREYEEGVSANG